MADILKSPMSLTRLFVALVMLGVAAALRIYTPPESEPIPSPRPSPTMVSVSQPSPVLTATESGTLAVVTSITDGDTFKAVVNGKEKIIRLIGIDTPEVTGKDECFGPEATRQLTTLILNKTVKLVKDVSETDRYRRLLRYAYVDDLFVNEAMVKEGYAQAASYPPDVTFQGVFRAAERDARTNNRGLWGQCK